MRNLQRYPITTDEIRLCLDVLADELEKEKAIGDMRPLLLRTAAKIIQRLGFVTYKLGEP